MSSPVIAVAAAVVVFVVAVAAVAAVVVAAVRSDGGFDVGRRVALRWPLRLVGGVGGCKCDLTVIPQVRLTEGSEARVAVVVIVVTADV